MGSQRVRHEWVTFISLPFCIERQSSATSGPWKREGLLRATVCLLGFLQKLPLNLDRTDPTQALYFLFVWFWFWLCSTAVGAQRLNHWCGVSAWACLTLCDSKDCSPPGCSVPGILRARILEWVAISFSRRSSHVGIKPVSPASSALAGVFFTAEPVGKPLNPWTTREVPQTPYFGGFCLAYQPATGLSMARSLELRGWSRTQEPWSSLPR